MGNISKLLERYWAWCGHGSTRLEAQLFTAIALPLIPVLMLFALLDAIT